MKETEEINKVGMIVYRNRNPFVTREKDNLINRSEANARAVISISNGKEPSDEYKESRSEAPSESLLRDNPIAPTSDIPAMIMKKVYSQDLFDTEDGCLCVRWLKKIKRMLFCYDRSNR
ncbi:hypothetical protein EDEG_03894 [Edhazardia aedis USNM 41457]|uniref:Uncharacterized protein n=1 Tax=Edhazardia aedis (strain USNM 41457) TaxID=1003232 RepID=J8ZPD0_EDHAE|nr:hypothetical protein EDEG_03894 [Edhazardia aedis USNM 41457]|eukprot:EJW01543.1 hypothetical protein EDEG_03894 [Edhazardia aedis USNM 41457]